MSPLTLKINKTFEIIKAPLLAVSYCIVSISSVFLNKLILSPKGEFQGFSSVEFLMLVQSIIGSFFFIGCHSFKSLTFPILLDRHRVYRILFINILFVGMTMSNAYGIRHLSMPMVALLKNCQVVVVGLLDHFILSSKTNRMGFFSLFLIVFGSILGSLTDLEFDMIGYISMCISIISSALYYVSIKYFFKDHCISEFTLVFYNNLLSIPYFLFSSLFKNEFFLSLQYCCEGSIKFWIYLFISGITGACVNLTTYMFISVSSPTSFSVLSVIKKITQTLLSYLLWQVVTNILNVVSVFLGVSGGILYHFTSKTKSQSNPVNETNSRI